MLFKLARKIMIDRLSKDEGLYLGYHANITMCIYDNRNKEGRLNIVGCRKIASMILNLIFGK